MAAAAAIDRAETALLHCTSSTAVPVRTITAVATVQLYSYSDTRAVARRCRVPLRKASVLVLDSVATPQKEEPKICGFTVSRVVNGAEAFRHAALFQPEEGARLPP